MYQYVPKGIGADLKGCPIPYMGGLTVDDLKGARRFITHYIVKLLLPDSLAPNTHLLDKALSLVEEGDAVITFNYDINFIFAQIPRNSEIKIIDLGDPRSLANRFIEKYGVERKEYNL